MSVASQPKLWTKDFIMLCAIGLLTSISMQLLNATMSLYADSIGTSAAFSGLISAGFAISAGIFRLVSGRFSDARGRRLTMIIGAAIFMICIEAFGLFALPLALLVFRTIQGVGFSTVSTASGAAITDVTPRERLGEGLGYFSLGYTLAMAVGPLVGIPLAVAGRFTLLYTITAAMIGAALILALFYDYEKKHPRTVPQPFLAPVPALAGQVAVPSGPIKKLVAASLKIIEISALPASIGYLICCLAASCVIIFASLYATRQGFANVPLFFLLQAGSMFASRFFAGRIYDKYGSKVVIIPGLLIGMLSFLLIALTTSEPLFLLAGMLYGLAFGMLMPVYNALSFKKVQPHRRGAASATFYLFIDIGMGLGTVIGGLIIDLLGFQAMFIWAAVCMVLALGYILLMFRNTPAAAGPKPQEV